MHLSSEGLRLLLRSKKRETKVTNAEIQGLKAHFNKTTKCNILYDQKCKKTNLLEILYNFNILFYSKGFLQRKIFQ